MKARGSRHNKMARHASMDLAGFDEVLDLSPDGSGANGQEAEHTYPSNEDNVAEVATEAQTPTCTPQPQPQLNLAAIRQTLDSADPSRPRGDVGVGAGAAAEMMMGPRANSGRSVAAAADPTDIVSNTTGGTSRRHRRQSNGGLAGRFSLSGTGAGAGAVAKMKRRGSAATGYTGYTAASSSVGSSTVSTESNLWTKLLSNTNAGLWNGGGFEDDDDGEDDDDDDDNAGGALPGCHQAVKTWCRGNAYEAKHYFKTCAKYPSIVVLSLLAFAVVLGAGLGVVIVQKDAAMERAQTSATFVANEVGEWFAAEFRRAMQPLYSVQQAVLFSGMFDDIPAKIGPYPERMYEAEDPKTGATKIMRDVAGICTDEVQKKFASIVEPLNDDANLDGIVAGYRLYTGNVMCTAHPMINSKDFPDGPPLDHNKFLGYDAGHDQNPFWKGLVEDLFIDRNPNINIFGPFTNPVLTNAFCGHLPVWIPPGPDAAPEDVKSTLDVQGTPVNNAMGFVMNFLLWDNLKRKSNIYERFSERNLEFCLTRTDGPDDIKTIAESEGCALLDDGNSIVVSTDTVSNGMWDNRVGTIVPGGWCPSWYPWAVFAVTLASFIIGLLTSFVLVEKQLHRNLLYKVMPRKAIKKLHRGQTVLEKYNLVTIFFSDIVGFTTMCGEMRPVQIMRMLNELYTELDKLVAKHKVYKVETIGDAYMVVGGAPDRCSAPDAAERVAAFALEAVAFVKNFRTKSGDRIFIRAGLASGPVVAGVVGDAMPRFCFFGDTVNFASRMESTSVKMKIQCSELTYRLLLDAPSRSFTLQQRVENGVAGIEVKGKGHQTTYWIKDAQLRSSSPAASKFVASYPPTTDIESPENVYGSRMATNSNETEVSRGSNSSGLSSSSATFHSAITQPWSMIGQADSPTVPTLEAMDDADTDDIIECVSSVLEHHLEKCVEARGTPKKLDGLARSKIRNLVAEVSTTYGDVPFHNFQHAGHVVLSMNKLVHTLQTDPQGSLANADPVIGFSLVFSALIHDAGHTGMSNKILEEQEHSLALRYSDANTPIAEKHSIDLALDILFKGEYKDLRSAILPGILDKVHFSKILFQSVLVTDIATSDRVKQGIRRFEVAAGPSLDDKLCKCAVCQKGDEITDDTYAGLCPLTCHLEDVMQGVDLGDDVVERFPKEFNVTHCGLKRCVLNEHLMLSADVSHTMQSWENYIRWNFRLYKEIMACHQKNLCPDPTDRWFKGEIGFFSFYIIPLAKRAQLFFDKEFGRMLVQGAKDNLELWKEHGEKAAELMAQGFKNGESEASVLEKIYALPETKVTNRRSSMEPLL